VKTRPSSSLDLSGSFSRSGPRIGLEPRTTTGQLAMGWRVGSRLQLSGTYTRSDRTSLFTSSVPASGQEALGLRAAMQASRTLTIRAGLYQVDPRGHHVSRQWDAGMNKVFGR
jgi:hypothetical protein